MNTLAEPRRGEVWFADVAGDKRRPVLVLTRDPMGRHLRSVSCGTDLIDVCEISTRDRIASGRSESYRPGETFR